MNFFGFFTKPVLLCAALIGAGHPAHVIAQTAPPIEAVSSRVIPVIPYSNWDERSVFAYVAAEWVALEGAFGQAADLLWPHAQTIKHPELLRRVTQWAAQGNKPSLALEASLAWNTAAPDDDAARNTADYLLVTAQRYQALSDRVATRSKTITEPQAAHYLRLASMTGPTQAASQVYTAVLRGIQPGPQDTSAHWLLARIAAKGQRSAELRTHLRAAAQANPPLPEAIFALFEDEPVAANQAAHLWTERAPLSVDAWRSLGLLQAQQKRPQQAADAFARGLSISPTDVLLHLERMDQLRAANQANAARDSLLAAYAVRASISQARVAQLLAEQLEDDYHPSKALEVYALAKQLAANDEAAVLNIQQKVLALKARQGDTASLEALLALTTAQSKPEEAEKLTYVVAGVLRDTRQGARAVTLLSARPKTPERDYELALALESTGQFERAESLLRAALKTNPKAVHLLNALGYGLVDRYASPQQLVEGTAMLEQAYAASPGSAAIADSLGWAYFRAGKSAQALPLLEVAYAQKRDPEVAAHLGEVLFSLGRTTQAQAIWAEGLSVDAQHKVLQSTLKRFERLKTP